MEHGAGEQGSTEYGARRTDGVVFNGAVAACLIRVGRQPLKCLVNPAKIPATRGAVDKALRSTIVWLALHSTDLLIR